MRKVLRTVSIELVACFLIGGAPAIIAICYGGVGFLAEVVDDLLPRGFPLYYVFVLSLVALAASWLLSKRSGWTWLKDVLREIQGIQSVYRLGAGFLVTFSLFWFFTDPPENMASILLLIAYGAVSFVVTVIYSLFASSWRST